MSHVTIECPDCHHEHAVVWQTGVIIRGEFLCECGTVIRYDVRLPARGTVRDPAREESEARRG